jgi:hypothetical protein
MTGTKITDLERRDFNREDIDHLWYVDNPYKVSYSVPLKKVFDWIKEKAETEGLTIELKGEQIIFITGKDSK